MCAIATCEVFVDRADIQRDTNLIDTVLTPVWGEGGPRWPREELHQFAKTRLTASNSRGEKFQEKRRFAREMANSSTTNSSSPYHDESV